MVFHKHVKQGKASGVRPSLTIDVPCVASLDELKKLLGDIFSKWDVYKWHLSFQSASRIYVRYRTVV